MRRLTRADLVGLVTSSLKTMAFIALEHYPGEVAHWNPDQSVGSVIRLHVDGESLEVRLAASEGFTNEFGSALLGISKSEFAASGESALALQELANILAGEVLRILGAKRKHASLDLPEMLDPDLAVVGDPMVHAWFMILDECLCVSVFEEA